MFEVKVCGKQIKKVSQMVHQWEIDKENQSHCEKLDKRGNFNKRGLKTVT